MKATGGIIHLYGPLWPVLGHEGKILAMFLNGSPLQGKIDDCRHDIMRMTSDITKSGTTWVATTELQAGLYIAYCLKPKVLVFYYLHCVCECWQNVWQDQHLCAQAHQIDLPLWDIFAQQEHQDLYLEKKLGLYCLALFWGEMWAQNLIWLNLWGIIEKYLANLWFKILL